MVLTYITLPCADDAKILNRLPLEICIEDNISQHRSHVMKAISCSSSSNPKA
jgi:hypothetical protein